LEEFVGEAVGPVGSGGVLVARRDEGQRVNERLAEDDLLRLPQSLQIEKATPWPWEVEMSGGSGAEVWRDLAAVELDDVAGGIADRDHQRAVEVLVA
jgi:hypothetical protein